MVREAAVGSTPDADVEPRRRDAAAAQAKRVDRLAAQRVLDLDRERIELSADAADGDVAAAVDDEARVAAQAMGDGVGREPLADPAGVDPDAGRTADGAALLVDRDLPPAGGRIGTRRAPGRRDGERLAQRDGLGAVVRALVADGLERSDERRVDEPAGGAPRPTGRL